MKKSNKKRGYKGFLLILLLLGAGYWYMETHKVDVMRPRTYKNGISLQRTRKNYGKQIDSLAKAFDLPSAYLKAVITLESSGKKVIKPRFEKHVFNALRDVRDRKTKSYGSITRKIIHDASDDALRNLATSWGPFQLMGYQCIPLDVKVIDIRGDNALYWGVYWINKRYGKYLREEKFKDAFHIHNTGQPFPSDGVSRTFHSKYVDNGLEYVDFFTKKEKG